MAELQIAFVRDIKNLYSFYQYYLRWAQNSHQK